MRPESTSLPALRIAAALLLAALAEGGFAIESPAAPAAPGAVVAQASPGASAPADAAASSERRARLRPSGPVTVTADRAEWEKGGAMVYTGKVKLVSDDLELNGDRLELRQSSDGEFEARVSGAPALLDHAGVSAQEGEPALPVRARASTLIYDSREEVVEVAGNANLQRGTDEISGETIRYDVVRRRIQATGSEGGQVKIVIQPPQGGNAGDGTPRRRPAPEAGRAPQAAPSPAPNPRR